MRILRGCFRFFGRWPNIRREQVISPPRRTLLVGRVTFARKELDNDCSFLSLIEYPDGSRDDFIAKCKAGDFNDIFAIYRSNEYTKVTGPFDRDLISCLPASVKYICHNGAGYDTIDVDACTERGISITHTPAVVNDATADTTIFLLLGALRRISIPIGAARNGVWKGETQTGHDPKDKILGILGMGGIGTAVAQRARAFGMKIQYHNRHPLSKREAGGARYVSYEELLQTSDVLSLNTPLTASTDHAISTKQFSMMKDGVIIVNTSRGGVIDEEALVEALDSGKVFSVGLDVYEEEPKIHPGLLDNENVVLLPHIATNTFETRVNPPSLPFNFFR